MMDWIPSWRWIPVAVLMLVISFLRIGINADKPINYEQGFATNLALSVTRWYALLLAITFLFPTDYDNYFVQFSWLCRNLSEIGAPEAIAGITAIAALSIASSWLYVWSKPLLVAISLTIRQLEQFVLFTALSALLANFLFVSAKCTFVLWHDRPSWLPNWLFWAQVTVAAATTPWAVRNIFLSVMISLEPGRQFLRSLWTLVSVSWVYIWPERRAFASSHPISASYPADDTSSPTSSAATKLLFLSDLHVASHGRPVMLSKVESQITLMRMLDFVQKSKPTAVVLVGDVTDTGDPAAWERVGSVTKRLCVPVFAIPGNHDVHFANYNAPSRGPSYSEKEVMSNLGRIAMPENVGNGFPSVVRIDQILLVLLNSNGRESSGPATNALGYVGPDQLRKAENLLKAARKPGDVAVVVLHHHLLLPSGGPAIWYLRCLDAGDVLAFARRNNVAATVNGHLHMPFVARYLNDVDGDPKGGPLVISCGSLHHPAEGPLAKDIQLPSAYLMEIDQAGAISISLVTSTLKELGQIVRH
ncbi:MAG: metallophosphoesterase [Methylocella sp.]